MNAVRSASWLVVFSLQACAPLPYGESSQPALNGILVVDTPGWPASDAPNLSNVTALIMNRGPDKKISLFEALTAINNENKSYAVRFNLQPGDIIRMTSTFVITASGVEIDGDMNGDGIPDVVIEAFNTVVNGQNIAEQSLAFTSDHNVLSGVIISSVEFRTPSSFENTIRFSYLCTDASGRNPRSAPSVAGGVVIESGAHDNLVSRNVIAACGDSRYPGINIVGGAFNNRIEGNFIGVDVDGHALGNISAGVNFDTGAHDNTVGGRRQNAGACVSPCNIISGGIGEAISIHGVGTHDNWVSGNYIGVGIDGKTPVPNGTDKVHAAVNIFANATHNFIGGTRTTAACDGDCNVISGNTLNAIFVSGLFTDRNMILGNNIGTDITGFLPVPNATGLLGNAAVTILNGPNGTSIGERRPDGDAACDRTCNLISGNLAEGIQINDSQYQLTRGNLIRGNFIGVDQTGTRPLPNNQGVLLVGGARNNFVGAARSKNSTTCDGPCNLISGNLQNAIVVADVGTAFNQIQGNFVGTDPTGTLAVPNGTTGHPAIGIGNGSTDTQLGGTRDTGSLTCNGECNLVSGNSQGGVAIVNYGQSIMVQGNFIGTTPLGDLGPGNGGDGISILNGHGNQIGIPIAEPPSFQTAPVAIAPSECGPYCNLIRGNSGVGVKVSGNSLGNTIRGNSIRNNAILGIDLDGGNRPNFAYPVTPNASVAMLTGPNFLQPFPVGITAYYDGADTVISGVVDFKTPRNTLIDLYGNTAVHKSGFGEGQYYLGSTSTTESHTFSLHFQGAVPFPFLSGTATSAGGETSEFSAVCGAQNSAQVPDADGDGLCDDWEVKGIDFDGDGVIDLDLPAWANATGGGGIGPKDVFVESDYMDCTIGAACRTGDASHKPIDATFAYATAAFDAANVALHVMVDEGLSDHAQILFGERGNTANVQDDFRDYKLGVTDGRQCGTGDTDGHLGTIDERRSTNCENILGARRLATHYVIFGHSHLDDDGNDNGSGVSNGWGNDVFITNGAPGLGGFCSGEPSYAACWRKYGGGACSNLTDDCRKVVESSTFMHELGHNLGLCHGGPKPANAIDTACEDLPDISVNYKPNYLSVMNYMFQFRNLAQDRPFDYSRWKLGVLDSGHLLEANGLGNGLPPDLGTRWLNTAFIYSINGTCFGTSSLTTQPINWDHSQSGIDIYSVAGPINHGEANGVPTIGQPECNNVPPEVLAGAEDWSQLRFNFRVGLSFRDRLDGVAGEREPPMDPNAWNFMDFDHDGIPNGQDNCPAVYNPKQKAGPCPSAPDLTPPSISPRVQPPPNVNGWNRTSTTVTWSVSDAESGTIVESGCDSSVVAVETSGTTLVCSAVNGVGLEASASVTIRVDKTPPNIVATRSPTPNSNGWNNSDVAVSYDCNDALSGVEVCSLPVVVKVQGGKGSGHFVEGTAVDRASNSATIDVGPIKIDKTVPVVTYSRNHGRYKVDEVISIDCRAHDSISGVQNTTCVDVMGPAYSFGLGPTTVSSTAVDRAGNTGSGSTTFAVEVTVSSLCNLTQTFVTDVTIATILCADLMNAAVAAAHRDLLLKATYINDYVTRVMAATGSTITMEQAAVLTSFAKGL